MRLTNSLQTHTQDVSVHGSKSKNVELTMILSRTSEKKRGQRVSLTQPVNRDSGTSIITSDHCLIFSC